MKNEFINKKNIIIILLCLLIIVILIYNILFTNDKKEKVEIVTSSSKFYTVSSCINRYINYLYVGDEKSLLEILDKNYVQKNKINGNNVLNKIERLNRQYSFEARKMYQQEINSSVIKYYVQGYLVEESLSNNGEVKKNDYYVIVYIDSKNSTYSIEPYNGEIFLKED